MMLATAPAPRPAGFGSLPGGRQRAQLSSTPSALNLPVQREGAARLLPDIQRHVWKAVTQRLSLHHLRDSALHVPPFHLASNTRPSGYHLLLW